MNEAEAKVWCEAVDAGYRVYRRGWPDFLIEKDGDIRFIEVKGPNGDTSREQDAVQAALARAGLRGHTTWPLGGGPPLAPREHCGR